MRRDDEWIASGTVGVAAQSLRAAATEKARLRFIEKLKPVSAESVHISARNDSRAIARAGLMAVRVDDRRSKRNSDLILYLGRDVKENFRHAERIRL